MKLGAGWDIPGTAHKAHYFPADSQQSLCKRWFYVSYRMLYGAEAETYHGARCQQCERKRQQEGGTAASPDAADFLRRARNNPAFNAMIERLADE